MSRLQRILVCCLLVMLGTAWLGCATSASIIASLESVVKEADVIVVARVDDVIQIQEAHIAVISVLYALKGAKAGDKLAFYAEPTWTCDTSEAIEGETALLCLKVWEPGMKSMEGFYTPGATFEKQRSQRLPNVPFYEIVMSGRGRMPVMKAFRGRDCVKRPATTAFPKSLHILWNKDQKPLARLADVENAIRSLLAHPADAARQTRRQP